MYGLILNVVESLIVEKLGQGTLQNIRHFTKTKGLVYTLYRSYRRRAGVDSKTFLKHQNYNEELFQQMLLATTEESGLPAETLLEMAGEQFFRYCQNLGHGKMLQSLGYNLPSFLSNLDALHDHLSYTYPEMNAPSFRCSENNGTLLLHYYSSRLGLESVVVGIIKAVGRCYFGLDVTLDVKSKEVLSNELDSRMKYHVVFEVIQQAVNSSCTESSLYNSDCEEIDLSLIPKGRRQSIFYKDHTAQNGLLNSKCSSVDVFSDKPWPVNRHVFSQLFPFHVMFTTCLSITSVGKALDRLIPALSLYQTTMTDHFTIVRPQISFCVDSIKAFSNNKFTLVLRQHPSVSAGQLSFKGQMFVFDTTEDIIFIGSPQVHDLEEMKLQGLFLSDYPLHDSARDLMMINNQLRVEKRTALMLEQTKQALEEEKRKVTMEKERADFLLHAMLPVYIANQLQAGLTPEATDHTLVSILFSDIKGFTSMCNSSQPLQIVVMLNSLYTFFDQLTEKHNVYKVETIGDAYMVAAGLLQTAQDHANALVQLGFDMRTAAKSVLTPNSSNSLQVRIGIHSGPVVSGVVGTKMPRFCLFGDTVNTASRMESHGVPGKIHISQRTYEEINQENYHLECRGIMNVKGLGQMITYFAEPSPLSTSEYVFQTQSDPSTIVLPTIRPSPAGQEFGGSSVSDLGKEQLRRQNISSVCNIL